MGEGRRANMPLSRSFRHKILNDKHLYKAIYLETVCDSSVVSVEKDFIIVERF
ncbi:MAG: hypothetical protein RXR18_04545 [Nitrososphaeria archaeon]